VRPFNPKEVLEPLQSRTVTLDPEGRLSLASADRLRLGLGPGDLVEFFLADGHLVLRRADREACAAASLVREERGTLEPVAPPHP
jgi:bifunctional DNA-binding transcriptional regulator/antitoxin component of YhaV-PrlF toxin-antitoxin module